MKPYAVKAVLDSNGNFLQENRPKVIRRVISPETAGTVARILKTVMDEGGTGKAARLQGYESAGKTGTAQKALTNGRGYSDKRIGSFFGFAPADNPQVVITIVIDEPQGLVTAVWSPPGVQSHRRADSPLHGSLSQRGDLPGQSRRGHDPAQRTATPRPPLSWPRSNLPRNPG